MSDLPTLTELISSGKLPVGTVLRHVARRYPERAVTATVVRGGIKMGGNLYTTPSRAAMTVTGTKVDGWGWWRLPDGSRLDSLRPGERRIF